MGDEYNYLDALSWYTAFSVQQALAVLPHQQQDQNKLCRASYGAGLVSAPAILENRTRSSSGSCSERTVCSVVSKMICCTAMRGNLSCVCNTVPWLLPCPLFPLSPELLVCSPTQGPAEGPCWQHPLQQHPDLPRRELTPPKRCTPPQPSP